MTSIALSLGWLDYAAVAVFAATGALAAARRNHDIVTFAFFAAVTGVGGGTLRDLLIAAPVFWVAKPTYLIVCGVSAVAVWFTAWGKTHERVLNGLDALGLAAYSVVGALKAYSLGVPELSCVVMGVLTSTFGGIIRDVLAEQPSVLLRREIYVTASLAGAIVFVTLHHFDVSLALAGGAGFVTALVIRGGSLVFGWSLPGFPGRQPAR